MKVLVTTDGSAQSMKAVQWALDLAQNSGASITLMTVATFAQDVLAEMPPNIQDKLEAHAQENLDQASALFDKQGVPVETLLEVGQVPANNILQTAEDGSFDLIVMGHAGMSGLKRALMGSTASKVVANAPCSVSIIR